MPRFCNTAVLCALILLSSAMPEGFARAADGTAREPSGAAALFAPEELEAVTVTAEKYAVDLQKAPMAITAIPNDALDDANIMDLSGLNGQVPGMTITKSGGYETIVTIRGVGSETPESEYSAQPGVSFNVDGVAIANTISLDQALFDIDHIEVLRGPQATVFGEASTGGAINVITRQPVLREFSSFGDLSYGNYGLLRLRNGFNVPFGDTLAVRVSVQRLKHDGFASDTDLPAYRLDDANDYSAKLAALWAPLQDFTATVTGQIYHSHQNGAEQKNILDTNASPRIVSQDYPGRFLLDSQLYYANLKWSLPWATAKSTSSLQYLRHAQQLDGSRSDIETLGFYDDIAAWDTWVRNITQELSLASIPGGLLDWTAGFFYLTQKTHEYVVEFEGTGANPDLSLPPLDTTMPPANLFFEHDAHVNHVAWAPYLQGTYRLTDDLRFTAGGRYNHDSYGGTVAAFYDLYGGPAVVEYGKGKWTGKAELQYDAAAGSTVYASFTHGYKPGGLNNNIGAAQIADEFQPEEINAYELGSKHRFIDNTLQVNAAVYYYDYKNLQFIAMDPVPYDYGIANIPRTHLWGEEFEVSYLASQGRLRLDAGVSIANGHIVSDYYTLDSTTVNAIYAANPACANILSPECIGAVAAADKNIRGNQPPKMPHIQGSFSAAYTARFGGYALVPRLEYIYRGGYDYRVFNEGSQDLVSSYGIINLSLALQPVSQRWNLALAVSNLANRNGENSKYTDPFGTYQTSVQYIAPRQVIGTVGYKL